MGINKLSNLPVVQPWIKQFLPKDRALARQLVDELMYYETSHVFREISLMTKDKMTPYSGVGIIPVRELKDKTESYFPQDNDIAPLTQSSEEYLGSEAYVSNLITQLSRYNVKKIIRKNGKAPSLNELIHRKAKALILVDDLIGSGKRVCDFLDAIYRNEKIKNLISQDKIKVHIVAFMASETGEASINRWAEEKHASINLTAINKCPTFHKLPLSESYLKLCKDYSFREERKPIGFQDTAVRVVFEHSAPNNLPTIFYKDIKQYFPKNSKITGLSKSWCALFSGRAVDEKFKYQASHIKVKRTVSNIIGLILRTLSSASPMSLRSLRKVEGLNSLDLAHYINLCVKLKMLEKNKEQVSITQQGVIELNSLSNIKKPIEINEQLYYPP
ncbi:MULTISPECIES: hypothetical protein [unclassified Pseudoalteromonas]|uniref:phosphoribosyltransferase-like protein n=1 Tax=unclassified Pseudoalteromonas TaxID=194690 RepID=UPI0005A8F63B|nr:MULTISPECIES: hypothetical protein [unclassified Pseudoalteromonas]